MLRKNEDIPARSFLIPVDVESEWKGRQAQSHSDRAQKDSAREENFSGFFVFYSGGVIKHLHVIWICVALA